MNSITETLRTLTLGEAVVFQNLAFFPLLNGNGDGEGPGYLTLDEALSASLGRVTEVSVGGSVPSLQFENGSLEKILLLEGEELVGAKQNRTLNVTILVGAKQTVTIPVSCVEHGRWSYDSPTFSTEGRVHFSRGRAEKAVHVSRSLETQGNRHADQGAVWDAIADKAAVFLADSPTGAMAAIFEKNTASLEEYRRALQPRKRQVGAVFAIGGKIAGLDLFDHPATLRKLWDKLVSSYALDALEDALKASTAAAPSGDGAKLTDAEGFLRDLGEARVDRFPAVGLGEDLRLQRKGLAGGALWAEGRVVHLAAFRMENGNAGEAEGKEPHMARASCRRAYRNQRQA